MPPDGGIRESMDTIQAWVYSTCHIMVESTVWFGRRSPMTWMRPGNKSLFWGKISPKSHFIHLQTRLCGWRSARVARNASVTCMKSVCDLQSGFRTVRNLREKWLSVLKCWQMIGFFVWKIFIRGRTWHSKWHEDLLSSVGMNDGLCAESVTSTSCVLEPGGFSVWSCGWPSRAFTYLLDLLGLPQLHRWAPEVEDVQVILTVTYWYMSCHTLWYQHQYWPDDWRHREEAYHVCSHREVGCILSVVSVYKENYNISDSVQHFNVLFKYCYLKVFEQSTPITYFASSRMLPPIGDKLVL